MGLNKEKIELLRKFVNHTCESCHKHEKLVGTLEPHKITPRLGYKLLNIKMVCHECHEIMSAAARIASNIQGKY